MSSSRCGRAVACCGSKYRPVDEFDAIGGYVRKAIDVISCGSHLVGCSTKDRVLSSVGDGSQLTSEPLSRNFRLRRKRSSGVRPMTSSDSAYNSLPRELDAPKRRQRRATTDQSRSPYRSTESRRPQSSYYPSPLYDNDDDFATNEQSSSDNSRVTRRRRRQLPQQFRSEWEEIAGRATPESLGPTSDSYIESATNSPRLIGPNVKSRRRLQDQQQPSQQSLRALDTSGKDEAAVEKTTNARTRLVKKKKRKEDKGDNENNKENDGEAVMATSDIGIKPTKSNRTKKSSKAMKKINIDSDPSINDVMPEVEKTDNFRRIEEWRMQSSADVVDSGLPELGSGKDDECWKDSLWKVDGSDIRLSTFCAHLLGGISIFGDDDRTTDGCRRPVESPMSLLSPTTTDVEGPEALTVPSDGRRYGSDVRSSRSSSGRRGCRDRTGGGDSALGDSMMSNDDLSSTTTEPPPLSSSMQIPASADVAVPPLVADRQSSWPGGADWWKEDQNSGLGDGTDVFWIPQFTGPEVSTYSGSFPSVIGLNTSNAGVVRERSFDTSCTDGVADDERTTTNDEADRPDDITSHDGWYSRPRLNIGDVNPADVWTAIESEPDTRPQRTWRDQVPVVIDRSSAGARETSSGDEEQSTAEQLESVDGEQSMTSLEMPIIERLGSSSIVSSDESSLTIESASDSVIAVNIDVTLTEEFSTSPSPTGQIPQAAGRLVVVDIDISDGNGETGSPSPRGDDIIADGYQKTNSIASHKNSRRSRDIERPAVPDKPVKKGEKSMSRKRPESTERPAAASAAESEMRPLSGDWAGRPLDGLKNGKGQRSLSKSVEIIVPARRPRSASRTRQRTLSRERLEVVTMTTRAETTMIIPPVHRSSSCGNIVGTDSAICSPTLIVVNIDCDDVLPTPPHPDGDFTEAQLGEKSVDIVDEDNKQAEINNYVSATSTVVNLDGVREESSKKNMETDAPMLPSYGKNNSSAVTDSSPRKRSAFEDCANEGSLATETAETVFELEECQELTNTSEIDPGNILPTGNDLNDDAVPTNDPDVIDVDVVNHGDRLSPKLCLEQKIIDRPVVDIQMDNESISAQNLEVEILCVPCESRDDEAVNDAVDEAVGQSTDVIAALVHVKELVTDQTTVYCVPVNNDVDTLINRAVDELATAKYVAMIVEKAMKQAAAAASMPTSGIIGKTAELDDIGNLESKVSHVDFDEISLSMEQVPVDAACVVAEKSIGEDDVTAETKSVLNVSVIDMNEPEKCELEVTSAHVVEADLGFGSRVDDDSEVEIAELHADYDALDRFGPSCPAAVTLLIDSQLNDQFDLVTLEDENVKNEEKSISDDAATDVNHIEIPDQSEFIGAKQYSSESAQLEIAVVDSYVTIDEINPQKNDESDPGHEDTDHEQLNHPQEVVADVIINQQLPVAAPLPIDGSSADVIDIDDRSRANVDDVSDCVEDISDNENNSKKIKNSSSLDVDNRKIVGSEAAARPDASSGEVDPAPSPSVSNFDYQKDSPADFDRGSNDYSPGNSTNDDKADDVCDDDGDSSWGDSWWMKTTSTTTVTVTGAPVSADDVTGNDDVIADVDISRGGVEYPDHASVDEIENISENTSDAQQQPSCSLDDEPPKSPTPRHGSVSYSIQSIIVGSATADGRKVFSAAISTPTSAAAEPDDVDRARDPAAEKSHPLSIVTDDRGVHRERRTSASMTVVHEYGEMLTIFNELPPIVAALKSLLNRERKEVNPQVCRLLARYPSLRPSCWHWMEPPRVEELRRRLFGSRALECETDKTLLRSASGATLAIVVVSSTSYVIEPVMERFSSVIDS